MKKKILIAGDSFAADWTVKHQGKGWVNMLSEIYDVTIIAQAGVSEYKIIKQIQSSNLTQYSHIIISHTSPFRIPVKEHPLHSMDILHSNCDLIYTDIKKHALLDPSLKPMIEYFEKYFDFEHAKYDLIYSDLKENEDNELAKIGVDFFENLYDTDYALFVHDLMLKYIDSKYKHRQIINITFFEHGNLYKPKNFINFEKIFKENRGHINHLNDKGNQIVFDTA